MECGCQRGTRRVGERRRMRERSIRNARGREREREKENGYYRSSGQRELGHGIGRRRACQCHAQAAHLSASRPVPLLPL